MSLDDEIKEYLLQQEKDNNDYWRKKSRDVRKHRLLAYNLKKKKFGFGNINIEYLSDLDLKVKNEYLAERRKEYKENKNNIK